ncbi:acyl-CoA dehydrogenase family protein [Ornithinibacillus contaminans]|uniref:acyl-CoA dehydrogenase family protein n=1 Tax=Ornithinibacillus contaminans TaxID=694055 RepID=UPI00064DBC57|nr:acyl-CoA dehydrogenase family protein [Ornithinibacillus contaminans]
MISFQPTAEELAFTRVAKDFAKEKIRPLARACETEREVAAELVEEAKELGFLSLEIPEEWGGLALPLISQVQIQRALSYGDLAIVQGFTGAGDVASLFRTISNQGGLQQVKESFIGGEELTSVLIDSSEPSKPWGKSITVQKHGSDYVLDGTTEPVRLAKFADIAVVFARDQVGEAVILLVDSKEWTVKEGDYRLGLLAAGLGRLSFEQLTISGEHVLAKGKEAERIFRTVQARLYTLEAAKQNGLMEAALDYATEYTAGRKAFGREIAKFQGVSFKIAKMAIEVQVVNHLTWEAALKADEGSASAYGFALRALYRAHRGIRFVTDAAVQLLGGHGYIQEFPVEKWLRDAGAQVALYGREQGLLAQRGAELLAEPREVDFH